MTTDEAMHHMHHMHHMRHMPPSPGTKAARAQADANRAGRAILPSHHPLRRRLWVGGHHAPWLRLQCRPFTPFPHSTKRRHRLQLRRWSQSHLLMQMMLSNCSPFPPLPHLQRCRRRK